MTKVGITTWFHYHNYGTALQVTALYQTVKRLGYDVEVVNYIPHGTRHSEAKSTDWSESERVIDEAREEKYDEFIGRNIVLTDACVNDEDFARLNGQFDMFIAGSDQVWSPIVFDSRYYLDYVTDNRKKIGYAASMGVSKLDNPIVRERIKNLLSQFSGISAREKTGRDLIEGLISRPAIPVLDPTLLIDYSAWRKLIPRRKLPRGNYILCYFLGDNKNAWRHATNISREMGMPLRIIPVFAKDEQYGEFQYGSGPEEFFNLVDGAKMVLTDSFHGAVFSILCSKQFYVFERFRADDPISQNSRVYNILNIAHISDRLIKYDDPVKNSYLTQINYSEVQEQVRERRESSLAYLKDKLDIHQPLVSIVVPVYNVEKYISQCLDSIILQTYRNIEIIVVDDGSPDKAGEIADDYAKKDKRLQVLHCENMGLPTARNRGYDVASGEYLLFVDSDDAIAPDYVEYMVGIIENTNTNVAMSLSRYDVFNKTQIPEDKFERIAASEVLRRIEYDAFPQEVWNKIYRKSFLDKFMIRHVPEVLYGEGNTFNHHVLSRTDYVGVGRRRVYYYRYNPESSTRKFIWGNRIKSLERALQYRQEVVDKQNKDVQVAFKYHKWNVGMHMIKGLLSIDGDRLHSDDYRRWRKILRQHAIGVLRADGQFVSRSTKLFAVRSYFSPERAVRPFLAGFEWEVAQREMFESIKDTDLNTLPWDATQYDTLDEDSQVEVASADALIVENERLRAELASHMSIKRSARLLLGNMKRRFIYGRER